MAKPPPRARPASATAPADAVPAGPSAAPAQAKRVAAGASRAASGAAEPRLAAIPAGSAGSGAQQQAQKEAHDLGGELVGQPAAGPVPTLTDHRQAGEPPQKGGSAPSADARPVKVGRTRPTQPITSLEPPVLVQVLVLLLVLQWAGQLPHVNMLPRFTCEKVAAPRIVADQTEVGRPPCGLQGTGSKRQAAKPAARASGRPAKRRAVPDAAAAEPDAHQVGPAGAAEG